MGDLSLGPVVNQEHSLEARRGAVGIYRPTEQDKIWFAAADKKKAAEDAEDKAHRIQMAILCNDAIFDAVNEKRRRRGTTAALFVSLFINGALGAAVLIMLGYL